MSIKLLLQAPGLNLQAVVTDDALPELITITQKFRDQDATASGAGLPPSTTGAKEPPTNGSPAQAVNEEMIRAQLAGHGAAELLNELLRDTYPEKVLLLVARHESSGGSTPWK